MEFGPVFACALVLVALAVVAVRRMRSERRMSSDMLAAGWEGYSGLHDAAEGGHDAALSSNVDDENYDSQGSYKDLNSDQDKRDPDAIRAETFKGAPNPIGDSIEAAANPPPVEDQDVESFSVGVQPWTAPGFAALY